MENKLSNKKNAQKIFLGVVLVLFGLVLLAARTIESGVFVLLIPGVSMLIWGCLSKEARLDHPWFDRLEYRCCLLFH